MNANTQEVVRRAIKRTRFLTGIACAGLMIAVLAQFALQEDWDGLPFLLFAAAMIVVVVWHFARIWLLPKDTDTSGPTAR